MVRLGTQLLGLALCLSASAGEAAEREAEIEFPMQIAITDFYVAEGAESSPNANPNRGKDIAGIVRGDLKSLARFYVLPEETVMTGEAYEKVPKFDAWQSANADVLVQGAIESRGERLGEPLRVSFRLWNVRKTQQMSGQTFTTAPSNWLNLGHVISDAIHKRLTGEESSFAPSN